MIFNLVRSLRPYKVIQFLVYIRHIYILFNRNDEFYDLIYRTLLELRLAEYLWHLNGGESIYLKITSKEDKYVKTYLDQEKQKDELVVEIFSKEKQPSKTSIPHDEVLGWHLEDLERHLLFYKNYYFTVETYFPVLESGFKKGLLYDLLALINKKNQYDNGILKKSLDKIIQNIRKDVYKHLDNIRLSLERGKSSLENEKRNLLNSPKGQLAFAYQENLDQIAVFQAKKQELEAIIQERQEKMNKAGIDPTEFAKNQQDLEQLNTQVENVQKQMEILEKGNGHLQGMYHTQDLFEHRQATRLSQENDHSKLIELHGLDETNQKIAFMKDYLQTLRELTEEQLLANQPELLAEYSKELDKLKTDLDNLLLAENNPHE